jgi:hypothetical protein
VSQCLGNVVVLLEVLVADLFLANVTEITFVEHTGWLLFLAECIPICPLCGFVFVETLLILGSSCRHLRLSQTNVLAILFHHQTTNVCGQTGDVTLASSCWVYRGGQEVECPLFLTGHSSPGSAMWSCKATERYFVSNLQIWDPLLICRQIAILQVAFYIGLFVMQLMFAGAVPNMHHATGRFAVAHMSRLPVLMDGLFFHVASAKKQVMGKCLAPAFSAATIQT